VVTVIFKLPILCLFLIGCSTADWRTANRESAKIAPKPEDLKESIFQIYIARAFSWRGYFATHPWISWKRLEDKEYTVAQIFGFRVRRGLPALMVTKGVPDRYWFNSKPVVMYEVRGAKAETIISKVEKLINKYKYRDVYTLWPGPNSNTFVDYIIRNTPELTVELPAHAIGKDYLTESWFFAKSPGGMGFQFSIFGLLALTVGVTEGIEVNLFGLVFGVDFLSPALKLPMLGRLGFKDRPWPFAD